MGGGVVCVCACGRAGGRACGWVRGWGGVGGGRSTWQSLCCRQVCCAGGACKPLPPHVTAIFRALKWGPELLRPAGQGDGTTAPRRIFPYTS